MRTDTSPSRGASTSTSSTRRGARCSNRTGAFMALLLSRVEAGRPGSPPSVSVPDAGLQVTVQQIDGQVHGHKQRRDEEDRALRDGVIALVDRPEDQATDTREREDLLDHDRAA